MGKRHGCPLRWWPAAQPVGLVFASQAWTPGNARLVTLPRFDSTDGVVPWSPYVTPRARSVVSGVAVGYLGVDNRSQLLTPTRHGVRLVVVVDGPPTRHGGGEMTDLERYKQDMAKSLRDNAADEGHCKEFRDQCARDAAKLEGK